VLSTRKIKGRKKYSRFHFTTTLSVFKRGEILHTDITEELRETFYLGNTQKGLHSQYKAVSFAANGEFRCLLPPFIVQ
jgi:hypothetical protein